MPPTNVLQRARVKPLCKHLEEHQLSIRIILKGWMIPHEDWSQRKPLFYNTKPSVYYCLQLPATMSPKCLYQCGFAQAKPSDDAVV